MASIAIQIMKQRSHHLIRIFQILVCIFIMLGVNLEALSQSAASSPNPEEVKERRMMGTCRAISKQLAPALQKIASHYPVTDKSGDKNKSRSSAEPSKRRLLAVMPADLNCEDIDQAREFIKFVAAFAAVGRNRVGVISIQTPEFHSFNQSIIEGLKIAMDDSEVGDHQVVFVQTAPDITAIEKAISDLVLNKQISSVILAGSPTFLNLPMQLLNALMVPTLVASPLTKRTSGMSYIFKVFPSEEELTNRLIEKMTQSEIKKIALLRPMSGKADSFLSNIKKGAAKQGLTITQEVIYNPHDYQSILAAGQRLLQIDTTKRAKEYQTLYKEHQKRAKQEGASFDPRFVILPPIMNFDAVVLPDHFKAVRYFAKVFKYLGVKKAKFVGNQEWRAAGLIEPYDPFLEGSFFADLIGSYLDLPAGIRGNLKNANFAPVELASKFDLQSIGYMTGQLVVNQLKHNYLRRTHINRSFRGLKQRIWGGSASEPLFDSDQAAKWLPHILSIAESDLTIE